MTAFECMLVDEYDRARRLIPGLEEEIAGLPRGSVVEKRRGGKVYCYHTRREGGRVVTEYIPRDGVAEMRGKIELRKSLEDTLGAFRKTMRQVERALGCDPDEYIRHQDIR